MKLESAGILRWVWRVQRGFFDEEWGAERDITIFSIGL